MGPAHGNTEVRRNMKEPGMGKRIEDVQELSKRYDVRRLTEEDVDRIYGLSAENPMFYRYCPAGICKGKPAERGLLGEEWVCEDRSGSG